MGDFIDDFIQEYKRQPSLWQTSHCDFKNRKKRQESYLKLIEVASKHNEIYNIERTKQKINNLRCAFRVQLKKYNEVKSNSKDGKEETYCPKRKYFESLLFLKNEEKPVESVLENVKDQIEPNEISTRTRQKAYFRRKIDRELEAITFDLEESDTDDQIANTENNDIKSSKMDIDSSNENEEHLVTFEVDSNIEKDLENIENNINVELQNENSKDQTHTDFIGQISITKASGSSEKSSNPDEKLDQSDENVIVWTTSSSTTSPIVNTSTTTATTTITPKRQFRQITPLGTQKNPTNNTRVVQVRTIKPSRPVQLNQSQQQNIISKPATRTIVVSSNIPLPSTRTLRAVSPLRTPPSAPLLTRKIVIPKSAQQQLTLHNSPRTTTTTLPIIAHTSTNNEMTNNNPKKFKFDFDSSNFEKILSLACSKIKQSEESEDDFAVFGKMVTSKLRTMESDQSLIAQKLITEILFDGQMKLLQLPQQTQTQLTSIPQIITQQQLQATPLRSLRHINTGGQTYFISEMNGTNSDGTIQFNTNTGNGDSI